MSLLRELRERARHVIGPVLGICLAAYFAYHGVEGERGFFAWKDLKADLLQAQGERQRMRGQRLYWEHRVGLLDPARTDPDMLDERARVMLGLGRADELMVLEPAAKNAGD